MKLKAKSINYHLTKACNMQCKFCFATFNDLKNEKFDLNKALSILDEVKKAGFEKITFAGGEPTLIPSLVTIVKHAKELGLNTTIVTNGYKLLNSYLLSELSDSLDWLALSVDSTTENSNNESGRVTRKGNQLLRKDIEEIVNEARLYGIKIKINTVVSKYNLHDDLNSLISNVAPERWKIFQAMPVDGQNSDHQNDFMISEKEYHYFLWNHMRSIAKHNGVSEPEKLMRGSYYMISPEGKLYDSSTGEHTYSRDILEVGMQNALLDVTFNYMKFMERGGEYAW